jgi:hypothetical protein
MKDECVTRRIRRFILHPSALILLIACASSPPPPPPPALTEVPPSVLAALCTRLRDEGLSSMDVVTTTQPLITPETFVALADAHFYARNFDPVATAQKAADAAVPMPVVVSTGSCRWRAIEANARRSPDTMTLELSSPLANPFVRNGVGLFARVSLAQESVTWYWVPLVPQGKPMLLGMR